MTAKPCPVCTASVNAENLSRHLEKVHTGVAPALGPPWRGKGWLLPATLALAGDALILRGTLGLRRRTQPLPCPIEVGSLRGMRSTGVMTSSEFPQPGVEVRTGSYVRIGALVVGCVRSTELAKHWRGFARGGPRRGCHLWIPPVAYVALQYLLAERGLLQPAISPDKDVLA